MRHPLEYKNRQIIPRLLRIKDISPISKNSKVLIEKVPKGLINKTKSEFERYKTIKHASDFLTLVESSNVKDTSSVSLYCWTLNQEYISAQWDGLEEFDCMGSGRLRKANKLLEWSKDNLNSTGLERWPVGLPEPENEHSSQMDIRVANEIFLCALGWMVHHEIGHVVLGHPPIETSLSEQEEKAADLHATDWLLSELDEKCPMMKKRAIGISVALLCLQSLEVGTKSCLRNTHPNANDRIYFCLSKYIVGCEEVVEAFCTVVLQYLFKDEGIYANINGESFSSIMSDMLFEISRVKS